MPIAVEGDINSKRSTQLNNRIRRHVANVNKVIDSTYNTVSHRIIFFWAVGKSKNLKLLPVVMLQHAGHQVHTGKVVKISAKVANPQTLARGRPALNRGIGNPAKRVIGVFLRSH